MRSASDRSGGGSVDSSMAITSRRDLRVTRRAAGCSAPITSGRHAGHDQFPAADVERQDVVDPARRREAAAGDDGDAAAERLGVSEDV